MKNKKFLTIIAVIVMSGVLLTAGAMAANTAGSAYEQFKLLLDEEHGCIENATVNVVMSVIDNGETVIALDGDMKMDEGSNKMSGSFLATGKEKEKSFEIYRDNDDVLLHLTGSDNWYRTTREEESIQEDDTRRFGRDRDGKFGENKQLRDALLDTVMGDYKDQVIMTEANGLRTFSLSFDEGNMPVFLQTLFQVADMGERRDEYDEQEDLSVLPQELQDVFTEMKNDKYDLEFVEKKLKKLEISFTVDQKNNLTGMGMLINCSGTDTEGTAHDLSIDFSMAMTNVGITVADEANPDSDAIITIDNTVFSRAGRRHGIRS